MATADGRITAALLLARQAVSLLEELEGQTPAPTQPGRSRATPGASGPDRRPDDWRGQRVPLSVDERAVLDVLADGADEDDTYRRGAQELETACHIGRTRLRTALADLTGTIRARGGPRLPLVQVVPGPRGRVDYRLLGPDKAVTEPDQPAPDLA